MSNTQKVKKLLPDRMSYTKMDLLNDIHNLVEKYLEQELAAHTSVDKAEITVESDSEGDDVDLSSGDIWDVKTQTIVGRKNLTTKQKIWFSKVNEKTTQPAIVEGREEPELKSEEPKVVAAEPELKSEEPKVVAAEPELKTEEPKVVAADEPKAVPPKVPKPKKKADSKKAPAKKLPEK
jgi:hypothetical protein